MRCSGTKGSFQSVLADSEMDPVSTVRLVMKDKVVPCPLNCFMMKRNLSTRENWLLVEHLWSHHLL